MRPLLHTEPLNVPPKARRRVVKATKESEFEALLAAAPSQDYRDIFILLRWAGLRISEATSLRWDAVDLEETMSLYIVGKGGVERYVDILEEAEAMLRRRRAALTGPALYVFPGRQDGHISPRQVARVMQALRKQAGIPRERGTPHKLRHAFATGALSAGAPLHVVQEQLGHANIATTSAYLHALPGQLRQVYDRRKGGR